MAKETTSVLAAVLHGSKAPTPQQLQRFTDFLTAKYHQPVELNFEQNDALADGFILNAGDDVYDWSLEGRLRQFRERLEQLKPQSEKIIPLMKEAVENFTPEVLAQETGEVLTVGDEIATVRGLPHAAYGEILLFSGGVKGMVQDLKRDEIGCILFGDGAAAAVYQATEDETVGILSTFTAADGSGAEYLHMEALPVEDPLSGDRTVDPKARFLKMQGAPVVRFTARAVPLAIDTALKRAGVTAEEIDWVVPHQANLRILDVIARRYHLPKEKIYVNMDRFGNTSSASVPICLNEMRKNGLLKEGQTIVCTGFGGGLTYGAFVIKL